MKTKTHLGKRVLSVVLSVLMVVTMLPTFAITASAGEISTHMTGRYFSNDSEWYNAATGANGLEWQSYATDYTSYENGMHYFSGNVALKINDNVTAGITSSTGMTLSFYFKKNETVNHHQLISFGSQTYNTDANTHANSFYVSSSGNWMMPDAHESKAALYISYVDGSGNERLNCYPDFDFEENTIYNCTIIITTSGVKYYIDGELKNTLVANNSNNPAGVGSYPANYTDYLDDALSAVGGFNTNYFGLSRWRDGFFKGSIGDFRIYNRAMTDAEFVDNSINDYVDKMNSGIVYTNMANAYTAYVDYNEALDANYYGNNSASLATAKQRFVTANFEMKPWNSSFHQKAYFYGNDVPNNAYSNVVYSYSDSSDTLRYSLGNQGYTDHYYYVPHWMVLVYDGNNSVEIPVVYGNHKTSGSSRQVRYVAFTISNFELQQYWKGYSTVSSLTSAFAYPDTVNSSDTISQVSRTVNNSSNRSPQYSVDVGDNCTHWNKLVYTGTGNTSNYYENITSVSATVQAANKSSENGKTLSGSLSPDYYIINFSPVISKVNTLKSRMNGVDVRNYKEGGLSGIMAAFDVFTDNKANPNSYLDITIDNVKYSYLTDSKAATQKCASYISAAVANTTASAATVGSADNANNYIKLRSYLTNGLSGTFDFGNGNVTLTAKQIFEDSAYNADNLANYGDSTTGFYKAYLDAVNHMAALPATTNVSDYNGSTAASFATALQSAFNRLSVKAPIDPPTISGNTYLGPTDTVTIHGGNVGASPAVTVWYDVYYDVDSTDAVPSDNSKTFAVDTTESKTLVLFPDNTHTKAIVKAYGKAANSSTDVVTSSVVFKNYNAPTADKADNAVITSGDTITVTKSNCGADGDIKYQIQPLAPNAGAYGATQPYSAPFNPFTGGNTKVNVKIWEEKNGSTSEPLVISNLVLKTTAPTIAATVDNGTAYLDADDTITITNTDTGAATLYHFARSTNGTPSSSYGEDETYSAPYAPFDRIDSDVNATYRIQAKSSRHGDVSGYTDPAKDFYYLTAPTVKLTGSNDPLADATVFASGNTVTLGNTNGYTGTIKYRVYDVIGAQYLNGWTSYTSAFNPFTVGTGSTKVNVEAVQYVDANTISGVKTVSNLVLKPNDPTIDIATGTYLDLDDLITITGDNTGNVNSAVSYDYEFTQGESSLAFDGDYSVPFAPFGNVSEADYSVPATYTITPHSTRNGSTSDGNRTYTYHFLSTPTIDKTADAELAQTDLVTITRTSGATGALQYSISRDGESWSGWADCSGTFAPFNVSGYQSDLILYVKVRERIDANTISPETDAVQLIKKMDTQTMYFKEADSEETSTKSFNGNGAFYVSNAFKTQYTGKQIYYQVSVDGANFGAFNSYDYTNGIASSTYSNATTVDFRFYVIESASKTVIVKGGFIKEGTNTDADDNLLVYHESFNGASASGTTFTTGANNTLGQNGTLINSGTAAVEAGKGEEYDYRKNVLKIDAPAQDSRGNYLQLANNPLASPQNAALAKNNGVTISFWRRMDESCGGYTTALAFTSYDSTNTNNRYKFAVLTPDGKLSFAQRGAAGNDGGYMNYYPHSNDITNHSIDAHSKYWANIVLTVDPTKNTLKEAFMMYIDGEPHEIKSDTLAEVVRSKNGDFANMTDRQIIDAFMDFVTDANTHFDFGYNAYNDATENLHAIWYDDIRVYTKVKTQVDINNMYTDTLSDSYKEGVKTSTSHDPTNVTVYTLGANSLSSRPEGAPMYGGDKGAGDKVGQEFIDYYQVDPATCTKEYYSFGTGLTVYHSTDNVNWTVVGDSEGRCRYQNQELFVAADGSSQPYTTTLATPLEWAGADTTSDSRAGAAGHLVWAPHVMYNLTTDKWMYYGSTSSWESGRSAVFLLASDEVASGYKYQGMIVKTSNNQRNDTGTGSDLINAIDACVYYEHDANGDIDPSKLHLLYGSWHDIMHKNLNVDGTVDDDANIGDRAISIAVGGGEGGYMVYKKPYYYYYISPGANGGDNHGGAYHIRAYRSTSPDRDFVSIANTHAMANEPPHGNSILTGYENTAASDYVYTSTGHSSVYTAYNTDGDAVLINASHAREYTRGNKPIEDGAMATRQIWLIGNVAIHNPVVYTEHGWPVMFPMQYDNTFSTKFKGENYQAWEVDPSFSAFDIEGTYAYNDMLIEPNPLSMGSNLESSKDTGFSTEKQCTIVASDDTSGVFINNATNKGHKFVITPSDDKKTTYFTLYEEDGETVYAEGVFANQGTWGSATPEFSFVTYKGTSDSLGGRHFMGIRTSAYPRDAVNAGGNMVELDDVIYTRKDSAASKTSYAMYGTEISDNINYITTGVGERVTTIKVKYPYYINVTDPNAVICLDDAEFVAHGKTAGSYKLELVGYRHADGTVSTQYSNGDYAFYKLIGNVSDYFHYFENEYDFRQDKNITGYPETGIKLLIQYTDGQGHNYGEYEFPFVMPNPAMAHTIQGIRNQDNTDGDKRSGFILFDRFPGSYGSASNIISSVTKENSASAPDSGSSTGEWNKHSTGVFNYLDSWGSTTSTTADYSSPLLISQKFNDFETNEGVNSGSYGVIEHKNSDLQSYTVSSNVIDTDYYIDYSDDTNKYITYEDGVPSGYKFSFNTSNIKWVAQNHYEKRWGATSYMLLTGDLKNNVRTDSTYDSNRDSYVSQNCSDNEGRYTYGSYTQAEYDAAGYTDKSFLISGAGSYSTNDKSQKTQYDNVEQKYTLGYNKEDVGRYVMSGYLTNPTAYDQQYPNNDYHTAGLTRALPLIDTGNAGTNQWNMHIDFTGKKSVAKNTDTSSAEKYANFIIEQGVGVFSWTGIGVATWRKAHYEEMYAYYNIGVHTTDKGAVREFVDTFANKEFTIDVDEDRDGVTDEGGTGKSVKDYSVSDLKGETSRKGIINGVTAGSAINAANYSVKSYNAYLDALAEAYWFVNNPRNTTYTKNNTEYEYSTAYNNFGEDHAAIYIADQGYNIFHDEDMAAADNTYSTDGKAHTDEVQAEIIANVIEAYRGLLGLDEYKEARDDYKEIRFFNDKGADITDTVGRTYTVNDVESIKIGDAEPVSSEGYTDDSWNEFVTFIKNIGTGFDYYTNDETGAQGYDKADNDINSWRYTELDTETYKKLEAVIDVAKTSLMPVLDTASLDTLITTKKAARDGGVFTGTNGAQQYTVASWNKLNGRISTAEGLKTPAPDEQAKYREDGAEDDTYFTVGKYDVTGVTKYEFGDVTYYAQNFDNTAFDKTGYKSADNCSPAQEAIYDELNLNAAGTAVGGGTNTEVLGGINLTLVDDAACYTTYDNANTVVSAVDMDKYTEAGQEIISNALSTTKNAVYASDDDLTAYNTKFSTNLTAANKVKKTTTGETDPQTALLLEKNSEVNTTKENGEFKYIKYFRIDFTVQPVEEPVVEGESHLSMNVDPKTSTYKKYYGESVDLDATALYKSGELDGYEAVNWSVSIYNGEYTTDDFPAKPRATQKLSGIYGLSINQIANNNMAVVAEINNETATVNLNKYNILDCYGHIKEVVYGSAISNDGATLTIDGSEYKVDPIPFYTLTNWTIKSEGNRVFTVKPIYTVSESFDVTYIGSTTDKTFTAEYDKSYTMTYKLDNGLTNTNKPFAAWAVRVGSGSECKYQIASYSESYRFYACTAETYVAIVNTGTEDNPVYKPVDKDKALTESDIDGLMVEGDKIQGYLVNKIKNRLPFISVETAVMESGNTKARMYARITEGCLVEPTSYGVLFHNGSGEEIDPLMVFNGNSTYKRAVTSKLTTGQFTYTLNKAATFSNDVTYRAYVNYNYTYSAANSDTTINALDYSNIAVAQV